MIFHIQGSVIPVCFQRGEPLKLRIKLPEDGKIKSTYPSFHPIYTPVVDNISGTISSVIGNYFSHSFIGDYFSSRLVYRILLCPNRTKSVRCLENFQSRPHLSSDVVLHQLVTKQINSSTEAEELCATDCYLSMHSPC